MITRLTTGSLLREIVNNREERRTLSVLCSNRRIMMAQDRPTSRFQDKLVNAMCFDIFNSVYNICKHDMENTQRSLSFLFFGEEHLDEMNDVKHPDVLKSVLTKRMISPQKFIEVFEHVHTL